MHGRSCCDKRTIHAAIALITIYVAVGGGCERFPEDPRGSLERALQRGTLRVGVMPAPPWVIMQDSASPEGIEPALIERFADSLDLEIEWRSGGADELFTALRDNELDLVIGGIASTNPWRKQVGFSLPYYTSRIPKPDGSLRTRKLVIAVTSGENALLMRLENVLLQPETLEAVDRGMKESRER